MKRKKIIKKIELEIKAEEQADLKFCTECGEALEDFAVSTDAEDQKSVIENYHNCKKTGKFKGDVCSKMFIITPPPNKTEDIL